MRAKLRHANDLSQKGEHEKAIAVAKEVESDLSAHGIVSAHALWACAVFSDHAGRLLDALDYVLRALRADPALVPGEQSLHIVVARCRESIVDGEAPVEERIALHRALAAQSLDDDYTRVAFAECLLEQGDHAEALRVAQAIVTLAPRATDAWRVVGAAATALGNHNLAEEAAARCMSARCAEGPAPVPNVQWGQA
jgi:tetratricopeptide (TPR) repeat protein